MHDGAFIRALEEQLGEMHVHREAYYGGTFTGNSAHRCLNVIGYTYMDAARVYNNHCTGYKRG